ncbi:ABC transporter ATP-binding protein [Lactiplantibacillus paraplantarum]|uniref:ABC transporter ATP-binding protein n=1 Tax=Lactiplantibacillus paraplantarum TaxID=60520 RepID=UPI0023AA5D4D|nr:ABC transporter ATP-binding protein [Lactiplantibacillus paraplantarum]WEE35978.1 ABC transporter ATP-binding protein [Lactiplantibacillus paraplantarum]
MNPYQWVWQYARHSRWQIIVACILIIINAAGVVAVPLLGGIIVDLVINQRQLALLLPLLAAMVGITLIRTIMRYCYIILWERVGQNSLYDIRHDLFTKLQSLDYAFFKSVTNGDIMARLTGDTDAIRHFLCWVTYNTAECVLWFLTAVIVMGWINWQLMLALIILTPIIAWLTTRMSTEAHTVFFDIRQSFARLNAMVEENISGNRIVRAFAREDYEVKKFQQLNHDYKDKNMASATVSRRYLPALDFLASLLSVIVLLLGSILVVNHQMTLGELVSFNGFLWMLNQPMRMSGWLINDIQRFSAATIKIRSMLATQPKIVPTKSQQSVSISGAVQFQHVDFAFSDAPEVNVLSDISFTVEPGQTLGILGETGSGKSTLMNLIARFYDPTSGRVLIDGRDVRHWSAQTLRNQITIVTQDLFLFSDSITDNINYGNHDASIPFIREMADIADANNFINQMPDGYDTVVGERGVGLSGGQKQRISLTRALVKNPRILILDDTTSALDMETEATIQQRLKSVTQDKTVFIIASRISSLRHADQIIVLRHGKIVARGNHESLLAQDGYYAETYRRQLGLIKDAKGGE